MKFVLKGPFRESVYNLMRRVGYIFREKNEEKSELIFIRPLARGGYPRFHLYSKMEGENLIFNLHLDQKRPIYKGAPAHAGEYEGEVVEKEAQRIKEFIK